MQLVAKMDIEAVDENLTDYKISKGDILTLNFDSGGQIELENEDGDIYTVEGMVPDLFDREEDLIAEKSINDSPKVEELTREYHSELINHDKKNFLL